MPIYEYTCTDCGTRFETIRSMREADAPIECTRCKSLHTARQISLFCAQSSSGTIAGGGGGGCAGCAGGSCAGCGHH